MGKASSSKKVARAKKAAGRPGAKKSYTWPLAIGAVVVVGVLLVGVSAAGRNSSSEPPRLGDHWHAAYGIYDCDDFITPLSDEVPDESGLHTHDDSLMHIHPFGTKYTGDGANIGNWGETVGLEVTDDSIRTAGGFEAENGRSCGDEEGVLQLWTWDSSADEEGTRIESDVADYAPTDGSMFVLAFAPEGAEIPKPPVEAQASLQAPIDVVGPQGQQPPGTTPTESSVPADSSSTTAPAATDPNASSTTVAPEASTSTAAP